MRALDSLSDAVSAFEDEGTGSWQVEGLQDAPPPRAAIETALALAFAGVTPPAYTIEPVEARDWVRLNQASFPPIPVARYFIHGSHIDTPLPPGRIGLRIDAATAFGTGEHATTRGCLIAFEKLSPRYRVLDMGTGTGILAIAAAKRGQARVIACDIDAEAVRVAARNAAVNGVGATVTVGRGASYRARFVARAAPFDLVFANILARPLITMARDLARCLAPRGRAILSGLLGSQEPGVLAAHRAVGLRLRERIAIDGWHTLILHREAS